jgi:hypothetical protein
MVSKPDREILFSLGFPGEKWSPDLGALVIPSPVDLDTGVMAYKNNLKDGSHWFSLATKQGWENFDNILMLAAYIQDYFDGLQAKQEETLVGRTGGAEGP